jgi:dTDP-4-amino-4,6-dideoxygalactose transaminase
MTEICAAMGMVNLDSIDSMVDANRRNYHAYRKELSGLRDVRLLEFDESSRQNYQYIVIEVGDDCAVRRDRILEALHAENVRARRYFWPGCHNMVPYRELFPEAGIELPNTQVVAGRVIVLPTGATVDEAMIRTVVAIIAAVSNDSR